MEGVNLSIDSGTLDRAVGKRKVRAIAPDGTLFYDEPKTLNTKLTERLHQIWDQHPSGLLDITEHEIAQLPPDDALETVAPTTVDEDKPPRDPSEIMSYEDMESLRGDVYMRLHEARQELWHVFELAKTLSLSSEFSSEPPLLPGQPHPPRQRRPARPEAAAGGITIPGAPVDPPVLPPGTYSTTQSVVPTKPTWQEAYELELALAAKQKALDECSGLIDAAIGELQSMASAGERFWTDIRRLKEGKGGRGQWAIVPKPDFGRVLASGEMAKDVIVPYAADEAPAALRARSLAAFDLDPKKEDALTFGARSYHRLRVTLRSGNMISSSSASSSSATRDVCEAMEDAQLEVYEEELFGEVTREASSLDNAEVESETVRLKLGTKELLFNMYDSRNPPSSASTSSEECDLILLSARLLLSKLHRRRKAEFINPSSSPSSGGILKTIGLVVRLLSTINHINSTFETFRHSLESVGISANVESRFSATDAGGRTALLGLLGQGEELDGLGGIFELSIEGSSGISITASPSSSPTIKTSLASFKLAQLSSLAPLIAEDLVRQLLPLCLRYLHEEIDDDHARQYVYVDALTDTITASGIGSLGISPPFDSIRASVSYFDHSPPDKFGGDGEDGGSLRDWLRGLAIKVSTVHAS